MQNAILFPYLFPNHVSYFLDSNCQEREKMDCELYLKRLLTKPVSSLGNSAYFFQTKQTSNFQYLFKNSRLFICTNPEINGIPQEVLPPQNSGTKWRNHVLVEKGYSQETMKTECTDRNLVCKQTCKKRNQRLRSGSTQRTNTRPEQYGHPPIPNRSDQDRAPLTHTS